METPRTSLATVELDAPPDTMEGQTTSNAHHDDSHDVVITDGNNAPLRQGTTSSARFNILCTMVGGGCLSLPMAFQKTGNGLFGPLLLILSAVITEFCFRIIVSTIRQLSPVSANTAVIGKDSFETMTNAAFGPKGFLFAKWLVTAMCFFGAVGYAVLLRDMLQPITDAISNMHNNPHGDDNHTNGTFSFSFYEAMLLGGGNEVKDDDTAGPSFASNLTMLTVILLITPVCTLKNLSSLEKLGAASMSAILILGGCIVYRSGQCNFGHPDESFDGHVWPAFQLWPDSAKDVLDAFPLFVSCYVCHYNIPAVHNELRTPTPERVNWWLRSTTFSASIFYMIVGLAGSAYGHCTPTGKVQGNVLLDFDEDDPLLLTARMCLACTITLAFPLLVIPARDIFLRSWFAVSTTTTTVSVTSITTHHRSRPAVTTNDTTDPSLREPLLDNDHGNVHEIENSEVPDSSTDNNINGDDDDEGSDTVTTRATATAAARSMVAQPQQHSFALRLGTAILVLWSAAAVASCVKSIDVVWDLLGSSLSILLSYLIPCGCFIAICGKPMTREADDNTGATEEEEEEDDEEELADSNGSPGGRIRWKRKTAILIAKGMVLVYVPLMVISTANAFYDTFFN